MHLLLGPISKKKKFDQIILFCYLPKLKFGESLILIPMSKVTSLCQTFNQSLYNTIYLRFSFEYLFENFIIVSLHMCISYIFFILFYFSYSYRQIVYYFFVALFAMFVLLSVVKSYHQIPECTQNL